MILVHERSYVRSQFIRIVGLEQSGTSSVFMLIKKTHRILSFQIVFYFVTFILMFILIGT